MRTLAPNTEHLLISELNIDSEVQSVTAGGVRGEIPSQNPEFPLAVIQRAGGHTDRHVWVDRARIQFDVWAEKGQRSAALLAARTIHAAIHSLEGGVYDDGIVTAVNDETVFQYMEDPDTSRPRYTSVVVVTVHPPVTVS